MSRIIYGNLWDKIMAIECAFIIDARYLLGEGYYNLCVYIYKLSLFHALSKDS